MSRTLNKKVELFSDDKNKSNSRNCQSVELFAMSPSKQILISTNGDRICPTRIFSQKWSLLKVVKNILACFLSTFEEFSLDCTFSENF